MYYIDPHIHMISRVTDDYQRMAQCGCVAVSEPAFWAGFDRGSAEGFRDYFRHLTEVEPRRAAQFGIRHYSWLCINAKEAENVALSRQVIAMIPEFLDRPNVLGIGEIGPNKNTRNEATIFQEHVDLAMKTDELILIHTPHLEDKYKGTRMIIDMLKGDRRVNPARDGRLVSDGKTVRAPLLVSNYAVRMLLRDAKLVDRQRAFDLWLAAPWHCTSGPSDPTGSPIRR